MSEAQQQNIPTEQSDGNPADEERRAALKTLGKYAMYTAPAMLALLLPKKCLAESGEPRP